MSRAREGQFPPPGELAELIYYWMQAWPKADLSEKKVAELYPYIVQKWREGMNLRHIAQTACSCDDGKNIDPSPVARRYLPRKLALPPSDAQPGKVFGKESLKDSSAVAKYKLDSELADLNGQRLHQEIAIVDAKLRNAKTEREQQRLRTLREKLTQQMTTQLEVAKEARERLSKLETVPKKPAPRRKETPETWLHPPKQGLALGLEAMPNPDFAPGTRQATLSIPLYWTPVVDLREAQSKVREFISTHGAGGGNFVGRAGRVSKDGEPWAMISYNGRVWLGWQNNPTTELDIQGVPMIAAQPRITPQVAPPIPEAASVKAPKPPKAPKAPKPPKTAKPTPAPPAQPTSAPGTTEDVEDQMASMYREDES